MSLFEWITGPPTASLKHCPRTPSGNTGQDTERKGGTYMLRNGLEPWHLLIVAIVVIALFGSKKLPDTARALGKSMRILKSEAKAMKETDVSPGTAPRT
ncbi:Sec-independent protein translocase subunit TatA [Streptomyces sp. NPDC048473]|uniref:Sec-independent protein translocase subunit TatA n=1 Tax=unclassified Streptomyces TaxID=2593676 RepID=UPI003722DF0F